MKLSDWQHLRVRSDLQVSPQTHQGQLHYVIKDPLTLRYFRLRPVEYAIFKMLDGRTTADEIRKRLDQLGENVEEDELQQFLKQLGAANFFENVLPNQSESLYQMAVLRRKRRSLWTQAKSILYIKVPLFDPDRLFSRMLPWIRFLWSKWALVAYAALVMLGVWAFASNWREAIPTFSWLLSPENLFVFWIIFMLVKVVHELAHAFTCKIYGGEVHELGILVLVLTPCMYCNISDAWILEKRWRRILISSAGIIVEVIIAAAAAIVWWASSAGTVNSIAYRVMILAGISSVLGNGNPLMKWDGYYILSDLLGIPNLRAYSVRFIGQFFRKYVLGMEVPGFGPMTREGATKLVYGVLSTAWIAYVMYRICSGMLARFPGLGVWVLLTTIYGMILIPLVRLTQFIYRRRGDAGRLDLGRLSGTSAALALAAYFLFAYNMGYSVSGSCAIQPSRSQLLRADSPGVLVEMNLKQGDPVVAGQTVARLQNRDLELYLEELLIRRELVGVEIDNARAGRQFGAVEVFKAALSALDLRIDETRGRLARLEIKAPFSGVVLSQRPAGQLGKFVPEGDPVCEIADLSRAKVTIVVAEADLRFVTDKADAWVVLRAHPWRRFAGTVDFISQVPLDAMPSPALSSRAGGNVVARPDTSANVPLANVYEVNILLPNPGGELMVGMVGKAKIASANRRLYDVIYTKVRENIKRSFGV